jgi:hypothetical protein
MPILINESYLLKDTNASNAVDTINLPRHRWYYYKEGFSPELVNKAIDDLGIAEDSLVVDPFNGSGTVTLTCSMRGVRSLGIEVNPFTAFIANTKSLNADGQLLLRKTEDLVAYIQENEFESPRIGFSTFTEKAGLEKWLFNKEVINSYETGLQYLRRYANGEVSDILKLSLISALMANANARRDGKCLKYKRHWMNLGYGRESFLSSFTEKARCCVEDVGKVQVPMAPRIVCQDARAGINSLIQEPFSLCITSPPYLNTFDYTDIYRPELFMGGFVESNDDLYRLRMKTVRSHIQANWAAPVGMRFGREFNSVMKHLYKHTELLMHHKIPQMVQAYFEDIYMVLEALYDKAGKRAQVWLVVSTSAYAGIEIPVDIIIGKIGEKVGFKLQSVNELRKIRKRKTRYSGNIEFLRESLIILAK